MSDKKIPLTLQRIIITAKGTEIQGQIREQFIKESVVPSSLKSTREQEERQRQDEFKQLLSGQPNAEEQLTKYSSLVQNRLTSPQQIQQYLETKVQGANGLKAKFIERQLQKASMTVYRNSRKDNNVSKSLPFLDFRQTQLLKSKYKQSLRQSGLYQLNTPDTFGHTHQTNKSQLNCPPTWETGSKRVTQMMFQEAKLERMIDKYEKFEDRTSKQSQFDQVYRRNLFVEPKFLLDLHKDVKESRVESLQELNARLMENMSLLDYSTQVQQRKQLILAELHASRYQRQWVKRRIPGESKQ